MPDASGGRDPRGRAGGDTAPRRPVRVHQGRAARPSWTAAAAGPRAAGRQAGGSSTRPQLRLGQNMRRAGPDRLAAAADAARPQTGGQHASSIPPDWVCEVLTPVDGGHRPHAQARHLRQPRGLLGLAGRRRPPHGRGAVAGGGRVGGGGQLRRRPEGAHPALRRHRDRARRAVVARPKAPAACPRPWRRPDRRACAPPRRTAAWCWTCWCSRGRPGAGLGPVVGDGLRVAVTAPPVDGEANAGGGARRWPRRWECRGGR